MKRHMVLVLVASAVVAGVAWGNAGVGEDSPALMISPQTLVLAKVDTVTAHTNIPASSVAAGSVALDGVAPSAVWADARGHLAARFEADELSLSPGTATLRLTGLYTDGEAFSAADTITVK